VKRGGVAALCCALPMLASCDAINSTGKTVLHCTGEQQYRQCSSDDKCVQYFDSTARMITHVIDPSRGTVDGMPADITDRVATWEWTHERARYRISIDRFTLGKTMKIDVGAAHTELVARCQVARRSF